MNHLHIAGKVYSALLDSRSSHTGRIPIDLRPPKTTGTVQDDPFDQWTGDTLRERMADHDVLHAGALTTPDLVVRCRTSLLAIGIEVKKVDETASGKDSRGLTLDYNSCVPCGRMEVKINGKITSIPTFYLFALISHDKSSLVTATLIDGDFLNDNFELHKQGKTMNTSSYGHGAYGEASVRARAMYNYPNPLNSALPVFYGRTTLVVKQKELDQLAGFNLFQTDRIERERTDGTSVAFAVLQGEPPLEPHVLEHRDIFAKCKSRARKSRTQYLFDVDNA